MTKESDQKKIKVNDTVEEILEYQKKGYLFHGSPNWLESLEPRQAGDVDRSREFNNANAVYASNKPFTMIFGLVGSAFQKRGKAAPWRVSQEEENIIAYIPKSFKKAVEEEAKGYLYVLPPKNFKREGEGSWQFQSKKSVNPHDVIEVSFAVFEALGGEIIWTEG